MRISRIARNAICLICQADDAPTTIYFWVTTAVYDGNLTEGEHRGHNGADVKCENQTSTITLPDRSEPYEHTAMLRRGIDAVNNHPKNLNIRNKGVREIQRPDETPIMDNYDDFWDPTEMTLTSDGVDLVVHCIIGLRFCLAAILRIWVTAKAGQATPVLLRVWVPGPGLYERKSKPHE